MLLEGFLPSGTFIRYLGRSGALATLFAALSSPASAGRLRMIRALEHDQLSRARASST